MHHIKCAAFFIFMPDWKKTKNKTLYALTVCGVYVHFERNKGKNAFFQIIFRLDHEEMGKKQQEAGNREMKWCSYLKSLIDHTKHDLKDAQGKVYRKLHSLSRCSAANAAMQSNKKMIFFIVSSALQYYQPFDIVYVWLRWAVLKI